MPEGYEVPIDDEGTIGEQILGRGDKKRSTKTFIENGGLATHLGFLQGGHLMWINDARRGLAYAQGVPASSISAEDVFHNIPEAQEILEIHQSIVEHKGSQDGYLVGTFAGRTQNEELERKEPKKSSSGEVGGGKRWS